MMPPIYQQKYLPAKYNTQFLPPVTADTSQIERLIEEQYNKTIILPETHSSEVTNIIAQPEVLPPILSDEQPTPAPVLSTPTPIVSTPTPIVSTPAPIVKTTPTVTSSIIYQPVLLSFIPVAVQPLQVQRPLLTQSVGSVNYQPSKSSLFQPVIPRTMTYRANQQFGTSSGIYKSMSMPYSQRTA